MAQDRTPKRGDSPDFMVLVAQDGHIALACLRYGPIPSVGIEVLTAADDDGPEGETAIFVELDI